MRGFQNLIWAHLRLRRKPGFAGLRLATSGCAVAKPQNNCRRQLLNPLRSFRSLLVYAAFYLNLHEKALTSTAAVSKSAVKRRICGFRLILRAYLTRIPFLRAFRDRVKMPFSPSAGLFKAV
jgi:hypothetical protein